MTTDTQTITKSLIPEDERMNALPDRFGHAMLAYESAVFNVMGNLCEAYNGGYWDFFALSNGGFYMAWRSEEATVRMANPENYSDEMVTPEVASLVANLYACSVLSFKYGSVPYLGENYHLLRDYVFTELDGGAASAVAALTD